MFKGDTPNELLLTMRQKKKLHSAFNNNTRAGIKLSKTKIYKITESDRFFGALLNKVAGPIMKIATPLSKNK